MKDEKNITALYQNHAKDQPPESLDQRIMAAAHKSIEDAITPAKKSNRSMWMAAASVALISPLLVWLAINVTPTQMEQGEDYFPPTEMQSMAPEPRTAAKPKAKKENKPMAAPVETLGNAFDSKQDRSEKDSITVSGSRTDDFAVEEGVADKELAESEAMYDEIAPSPVISLERNRALLKSEFKAKKQRITQDSIADPMMALEWQQLQQHIEQGDKTKAQALLAIMQVDWPNYDFTGLEEQVENME